MNEQDIKEAGKQKQAAGRPGAMTVAMQAGQLKAPVGPKVLRIGLIQQGKIVEERIIRTRETVSVGSSEKNHFVVQTPGMPSKFDLFQMTGSDYVLNFTEHMTGRVGLPSGVHELQALRSSGEAKHAGTHWQVKLSDTSRGKVVVGDITFLFQFVNPPPPQTRPQLPATVRGGVVKNIDWMFTGFILFSFMAHFGLVVYLENADWPVKEGVDEIPKSIQGLIFNEPPPPEEEKKEKDDGKADEKAAEAPKKEAPSKKEESAPSEAAPKEDVATSAEARARIAEEAAQSAEALLLGALGESGGGLADVLAGGAVTGNAEDVLAQAAGVGVAQGGAGALRERSGGGNGTGVGGLGSLAAAGGGGAASEGGAIAEKTVKGKINVEDGEDIGGSGDFDSSVVVKMIRTRIRAIQHCYEAELRRNPTLAGKVVVEFTIQTTGSVTNVKATQNTTGDANVAECVVATIQRFRFNDPAPEGGSVTFQYPFVFAPQN